MRKLIVVGMLVAALTGCLTDDGNSPGDAAKPDSSSGPAKPDKPGEGLSVEPGWVQGRVVDEAGNPVVGAEMAADNQLLYDSNSVTTTDADGFYRAPTDVAATFHMSGKVTRELNGRTYAMDLAPEDDSPFSGPDGAIRNFTWKLTGEQPGDLGHYGSLLVYYLDLTDPQDQDAFPDEENVRLTLVPQGKLIDGSEGRTIERQGRRTADGPAVEDVPLGRYRITADYQGRPLGVKIRNDAGDYAPEVVADFENYSGTLHRIELELKL